MKDQITWFQQWGGSLRLFGCSHCQSVILSRDPLGSTCPYCQQDQLAAMEELADKPVYINPPEAYLPHTQNMQLVRNGLKAFSRSIPYLPEDFSEGRILQRLQKAFLPMWWVDTEIQANWQGKVGFPYEVVSHEETYKDGRWQSKEVSETRLNWELRFGKLTRTYDNIEVNALTYFEAIGQDLGEFDTKNPQPYTPLILQDHIVILPDRSEGDAWEQAREEINFVASHECRKAAAGLDIIDFNWTPVFGERNWTHLLLPIYLSYYLDDKQQRQVIYIHGQSGKIWGKRQASEKKGRNVGIRWITVGAVIVLASLLGLLLLEDIEPYKPLYVLGIMTAISTFIVGLTILPKARSFNQSQDKGFLWGT